MSETQIEIKNNVPNNLTHIGIALKYTFLDYIRSRRFYIMLIITLLIGILLTFLVWYRPDNFKPELSFYNNWWGSSVTFVIVLSGIFFGGDAISGEFQNKTGYFGIPNPIKRSSIYIGKWLAAFIAATIILGVFTAITIGNGVYYFSGIPYQFGESFLFSLVYLAAILGFTFFISSVFKSSTVSILITAIMFLFVFSLIAGLVASVASVEPWFILTYGGGIISSVLKDPYPLNVNTSTQPIGQDRSITLTTYSATIPEGLAIIAIYFIITTIIGLILFERKEFN